MGERHVQPLTTQTPFNQVVLVGALNVHMYNACGYKCFPDLTSKIIFIKYVYTCTDIVVDYDFKDLIQNH